MFSHQDDPPTVITARRAELHHIRTWLRAAGPGLASS
jgi:hypothetical protein